MTDLYTKLAHHLDKLPAGYPATDTGVELRILKRLFTEEEAKTALGLTMIPEPWQPIAERLGKKDDETLIPLLESMSRKGLIFRSTRGGITYYMASQFVIGIWEYHLKSLDKDLIKDVNEYLPLLMEKSWVQNETKQLRVIPISKTITAEMTTMPYEAAEEIIKSQSKIVVSECICRKEHGIMDKGCDYPLEVCLSFGTGAFYYEENGLGRAIDQKEALEVLAMGQKAGLVLQPGNSKKPANICMCCGCCCQVLKNLNTLESPALAVHTNYFAMVDQEECIGCGDCIERCHMGAIIMAGETAQVEPKRCIGCGVCISECPTEALKFEQKEPEEQYDPPANIVETYMNIAKERGLI